MKKQAVMSIIGTDTYAGDRTSRNYIVEASDDGFQIFSAVTKKPATGKYFWFADALEEVESYLIKKQGWKDLTCNLGQFK